MMAPPRFLSQAACEALVAQIRSFASGRGIADISVLSQWRSDVRWARNRTSMAGEWRDTSLSIKRSIPYRWGGRASTNQIDAASLRAAVAWAERMWRNFPIGSAPEDDSVLLPPDALTYPATHIWSDTTYAMSNDQRNAVANHLIASADAAGMLSAGYLSVVAVGTSRFTQEQRFLYAPQTLAQCSLTVRDPDGKGSGWAGASSYDWSRFDAQKLADIALEKCLTSRNPVAIEPGRYTTILEPQATFELMAPMFRSPFFFLDLTNEERSEEPLPFHDESATKTYPVSPWEQPIIIKGTKIGERVLDERISLTFDPLDPDLGIVPFTYAGEPYVPVTWVDHGVLTTLAYDRAFAQHAFHASLGKPNSAAFRMSGGDTSIEEMIATTKRGLLVTRFWGTDVIDPGSILCTGVTRDGLWLIENGKISKAVKNLRFTESPLFAFNQVDQLGVPVPVFSPRMPAICPPAKVRDFSFTALTDAI